MKIAHLPFGYFPDPVGGTEVYVRALAREQQKHGHEPIIIAPAAGPAAYEHEGVPVFRYAVTDEVRDVAELYSSDASVDAAGFEAILRKTAPDVLHVHGYTRAVTRRILHMTRALGVRIVYTYHTPTATCLRGTLMRWGDSVCDGRLIVARCTACKLQSRGVPRLVALAASRLPPAPRSVFRNGPLATGLRMRELVELRLEEIRDFLSDVDHIVAPAEWVRALLMLNGVAAQKISLNRQGTFEPAEAPRRPAPYSRLRLAFLGRLDATKGLHVVIEALSQIRAVDLELHVYTVTGIADAYGRRLMQRAQKDPRIVWHQAVPQPQVLTELGGMDVLVVPSQWLETGPLVVLEAFAAGVPVLGSRLGGIAELVRAGVDGLLVEPADVRAWAEAMGGLAHDPMLRSQLAAGIQAPRTMADVARDMEHVYATVRATA